MSLGIICDMFLSVSVCLSSRCFAAGQQFTSMHLKPEPLIVSRVPPAVPPLRGETSLITGVSADL